MFRQGHARLLIPALLIVVAAAMLSWMMTMREDDSLPVGTPRVAAYGHVCAVANASNTGDGKEAERGFLDDAHGPLHELAASAGTEDRTAAGRLLEAKPRVERAVEVADRHDPGPCL